MLLTGLKTLNLAQFVAKYALRKRNEMAQKLKINNNSKRVSDQLLYYSMFCCIIVTCTSLKNN